MKTLKRISSILSGIALFVVAGIATWTSTSGCSSDNEIITPTSQIDPDRLLSVAIPDSVPSRIIDYYKGTTISFNVRQHIPNWVAWKLTRAMLDGDIPREKNFYVDYKVAGCATLQDYRNSGYDRGHMAPAGDMKWNADAMHDSFYLTNICPQAKALNTGAWKNLEEKCRNWAKADSLLIIICGPVLTRPILERIGNTGVAVPDSYFKVILSPNAKPARGIAFIMPNGKVSGGLQKAAVSIDSVEALTGFNFFPDLDPTTEAIVESQCDFHRWSTL